MALYIAKAGSGISLQRCYKNTTTSNYSLCSYAPPREETQTLIVSDIHLKYILLRQLSSISFFLISKAPSDP